MLFDCIECAVFWISSEKKDEGNAMIEMENKIDGFVVLDNLNFDESGSYSCIFT